MTPEACNHPHPSPVFSERTSARLRRIAFAGLSALAAATCPITGAVAATVELGWNPNPESGIQRYRVHVGTGSGEYNQIHDAGTSTTFSVHELEYGGTYWFAVSAIGATGLESALSAEVSVNLMEPVPVATVELGWNPVPEPGIQGYRVHVGTRSREYDRIHDAGTATTFTVNDLEYGGTYWFAVSAIGATGLESALSAEVSVNLMEAVPVATADFYSALTNFPLVVTETGVLENDTGGGYSPLVAVLNSSPGHGSLELDSEGGFTYTPTSDYVGTDSFTYHAAVGNLHSEIVTVTISVTQSTVNPPGTIGTPSLTGSPGAMVIQIAAAAAGSYVFERSADLVNWTVVGEALLAEPGMVEFVDSNEPQPQENRMFYRVGLRDAPTN